ncbi:MAG: TrpR-related protein YerC/YecD [Ruminococcaceae bacterium]|nr:TrpR-related protein YerC/YecD [Oscillospiraceae bacterium]
MGISDKITELYRIITGLKTIEECEMFFDDLCTKKEIEKMAERIYAAKLLMDGKTYNQVIAETEISSATLSRVSQCVQYGNGYSKLLKKDP